jgi:hypothetical protein
VNIVVRAPREPDAICTTSQRTIDGRSAVGAVPLPIQSTPPSRPITVDLRRGPTRRSRGAIRSPARGGSLGLRAYLLSGPYTFPDQEVREEWQAILAAAGSQPRGDCDRGGWGDGRCRRRKQGRVPSKGFTPGRAGATKESVHDYSRRRLEVSRRALWPFYERHGWRRDARRNQASFPLHPSEVGYTIELDDRPTDGGSC